MIKRLLTALILATAISSTGCLQTLRDWYNRPPAEQPDHTLDLPAGTQWVFGRDISAWPQTITLKSASIRWRGGDHEPWEVLVDYDRLQDIPAWYVPGHPDNVHNVNGSIWLVREFRGQWYIGTIDYLRVGQMQKRFTVADKYLIAPVSGDRIGVMVSTMARAPYDGTTVTGDEKSPYRERSGIVWTVWP